MHPTHGGAKQRRIASVLLAAALCAVAAGLALAPSSAGDTVNTWSGTWVNSAPDGTFWVFTQSGGTVGGVWKGNAASGTLSGTVSGTNLTGTLANNEAGQSANFSINLAADGRSFSGSFTIVGGSTGQWRSACAGGACLSNAAPAPPPGTPAPPGAPASPASPKLLAAAAAWGQLGPAVALPPGGEAIATSPRISPGQRGATVTLSGDVSGETAVVFNTGFRIQQRDRRLTRGDCIRAVPGVFAKFQESKKSSDVELDLDPALREQALTYTVYWVMGCLDFVKKLDQVPVSKAVTSAADAARASCRVGSRRLSVEVDTAALKLGYRAQGAPRSGSGKALRVSCRQAKDGKLTVRIRTRSRRTKLRKLLGPRLVVGLYRSARASSTASVRTAFKR